MMEKFDYVITMEGHQRDLIRWGYQKAPELAAKVYTLKEIARNGPDPDGSIPDPYDQEKERYRKILHEIKVHVHWAIEEILGRIIERKEM